MELISFKRFIWYAQLDSNQRPSESEFAASSGLYTDMNAIRRDEKVDNLHSIYVDQWEWEKHIEESDRTVEYLKDTVRDIVGALCDTSHRPAQCLPRSDLQAREEGVLHHHPGAGEPVPGPDPQ